VSAVLNGRIEFFAHKRTHLNTAVCSTSRSVAQVARVAHARCTVLNLLIEDESACIEVSESACSDTQGVSSVTPRPCGGRVSAKASHGLHRKTADEEVTSHRLVVGLPVEVR